MGDFALNRNDVTSFQCGAVNVNGSDVRLHYSAKSDSTTVLSFIEEIKLPASLDGVPERILTRVLRLLSLAASLSYFKAFSPTTFEVPGGLTQAEENFITELIRHGLGEFAYVNEIPEVLTPVVSAPRLPEEPTGAGGDVEDPVRRVLVAVGGGKDSIVSIESLRNSGLDTGLFAVNPRRPIISTAKVAGLPLIGVERRLDPKLFSLNDEGAPNGHIPVTAINSLIAVLVALALEYDAVVFSNEYGSSYGNLHWQGQEINHQWSKSLEFERLLRATLPAGAPGYFSLLRPLNEIRIMRRFAEHREYHRVFTSCNRAFTFSSAENATWCGECPKCQFVFLTLAPFLSRKELLAIFNGRDLFADESQREGFLALLGADGLVKPFECVGEPGECRVALTLISRHPDWRDHPFVNDPAVRRWLLPPGEEQRVFAWHEDAGLPPRLEEAAREI